VISENRRIGWSLAPRAAMVWEHAMRGWKMDFEAAAKRTGYSVYTTEFDEVRDIRDVYTTPTLAEFRDEAEQYRQYGSPSRLASSNPKSDSEDLEKAVAEFRETLVNTMAETGIDPSESVIGFLLDNSGSIRNLRAVYARAMPRVCAALDSLGFDTCVVGHTTVRWKGGESRKKWLDTDRTKSPGRLNDLLITVYKYADEPMAEGDLRLYGLNCPSNEYKENIDGEALAWMAEQLDSTQSANKTLLYVSDGEPVDDSTLSCHPADYLLNHRNAVIEEISSASDIGLVQVIATEEDVREPNTDIPRFGGTTTKSSELVRAIGQAVEHALRMNPRLENGPAPKSPKM
jgi:cobaltochelatase CobT